MNTLFKVIFGLVFINSIFAFADDMMANSTTKYSQPSQAQEDYNHSVIKLKMGNTLAVSPPIPQSVIGHFFRPEAQLELQINKKFLNSISAIKKLKVGSKNFTDIIADAAAIYQIEPIHIYAAIIGEHTFNTGITDSAQEYALKLLKWTNFLKKQNALVEYLGCPELKSCESLSGDDHDYWMCIESSWTTKMAGRMACGAQQENIGFVDRFFSPNSIGVTYGIGQIGPLKALSINDYVVKMSGFKKISIYNQTEIYDQILNPEYTVHYIAAIAKQNINFYNEFAHIDISENPGVTATLYNLGKEKARAKKLYYQNLENIQKGRSVQMPQVNHIGWFINDREAEIRAALGLK